MSYSAILINALKNHGIRTDNIHQDPNTGLVAANLTLGKLPALSVQFPSDFLGVTVVAPDGSTDYTMSSPDDPADIAKEIIEVITSS